MSEEVFHFVENLTEVQSQILRNISAWQSPSSPSPRYTNPGVPVRKSDYTIEALHELRGKISDLSRKYAISDMSRKYDEMTYTPQHFVLGETMPVTQASDYAADDRERIERAETSVQKAIEEKMHLSRKASELKDKIEKLQAKNDRDTKDLMDTFVVKAPTLPSTNPFDIRGARREFVIGDYTERNRIAQKIAKRKVKIEELSERRTEVMRRRFEVERKVLPNRSLALDTARRDARLRAEDSARLRIATAREVEEAKRRKVVCPPLPGPTKEMPYATPLSSMQVITFTKRFGLSCNNYQYAAISPAGKDTWSVTGRTTLNGITWQQLLEFVQSDEKTAHSRQRALNSMVRMSHAKKTAGGVPLHTVANLFHEAELPTPCAEDLL